MYELYTEKKNDFAKVSKNLAGYRSENKFVGLIITRKSEA